MEERKDKISIIIGIVGAVFMIASVIATQIADEKIAKWNFSLFEYQNEANDLLIKKNESSREADYFGMMTGFDYDLSLEEVSLHYLLENQQDSKITTITNDFRNRAINQFEFLNQMQTIKQDEKIFYLEGYNRKAEEINEHYKNKPTGWIKTRGMSIFLQMFFGVLILVLNLYLFILNNKNMYKGKQMNLEVGVKIFLKNEEGKILLLKRSPEKYGETSGRWDIPGGRIIPGGELIDNLKREVREETHLEIIGIPRFVYAQDIILADLQKHVVRLSFLGVTSGQPILNEEHTEYKWLSLAEIENQEDLDKYVKEIIKSGIIE